MKLSPAATILGYAGLLPPLAALAVFFLGPAPWQPYAWQVAVVYALVIFAFMGGTWWLMAMRAPPARQWPLLVLAVLPPLGATVMFVAMSPAVAMLLGALHLALLPADRLLERSGVAPAGWLRLRVPLAAGLGSATILVGYGGLRLLSGV